MSYLKGYARKLSAYNIYACTGDHTRTEKFNLENKLQSCLWRRHAFIRTFTRNQSTVH